MSITETSTASNDPAGVIPLSYNQEFLCMFDQGEGDGPFGPKYVIVYGWRVGGEIDVDALRAALGDLVERHEALRTTVVRGGEERYQRVEPVGPPELELRDLPGGGDRHHRAEELLNELERGTLDIREVPLLRAVLARFDDQDAVLVLIAHHTAVDGLSMQVLIRDLAACYTARKAGTEPDLPPLWQYQDFARWQREAAADEANAKARAYWREALRDAQMLALRTDTPRSAKVEKATSWERFLIEADVAAATLALARASRSSTFITLLAAYNLVLSRTTGSTDVIVPTFTTGRGQARFHDTVGSFFNFFPIRTDLAGCRTFREAIDRTRTACVAAYSKEIPFAQVLEEAPQLMAPLAEDDRAVCAFQVVGAAFASDEELSGDLRFEEIRRRLLGQPEGIDVPDGALWSLDLIPSGELVGSLGFNRNLFDVGTMRALVSEFRTVLRNGVTAPDAPLEPA